MDGQNDNGWDQGLLFLNPKAGLSGKVGKLKAGAGPGVVIAGDGRTVSVGLFIGGNLDGKCDPSQVPPGP